MTNTLDTYLEYETWMMRYYIGRCRDIEREQLFQKFDIGQGMVISTLVHTVYTIEAWTDIMRGNPAREFSIEGFPMEIDGIVARFDAAMADFAAFARGIDAENRLEETFIDTFAEPPLRKSLGGTILHVLTHTTGHRGELQHMLQRLGITDLIEGDVQEWEMRTQGTIVANLC